MTSPARVIEAPQGPALSAQSVARPPESRDAQLHAAVRSPLASLATVAFTVFMGVAPLFGPLRRILGVELGDTLPVSAVFAFSNAMAAVCYRLGGRQAPAYVGFNLLENAAVALGSLYLVYRSGAPGSFYWAFYFMLVFQTASTGSYRVFNGALLVGTPLLLALAFVVGRGDAGAAALCAGQSLVGGLVYWMLSRSSLRLAEATLERERLQARVSELLVHEERARIARDLHDGLGAELAALFWRASALKGSLGDGADADLTQFMDRVRQSTDELRSIVWALRAEGQTWADLAAHLRGRCAELCAGQAALEFHDVPPERELHLRGELRLHIVRLVQEAVRNAVRHGRPARIKVMLLARSGGLSLSVEDDGRGIPEEKLEGSGGGLRNMRHRVEATGGTLRIETGRTGTRLEVRWPSLPA